MSNEPKLMWGHPDDGVRTGGSSGCTVRGELMNFYVGRFRVRKVVTQTTPGGIIANAEDADFVGLAVSCATPGRYCYMEYQGNLYRAPVDHVEKLDPDSMFGG